MSFLDGIIEPITLFLLLIALGSALVLVLMWQNQRKGKEISIWLFSLLLGVFFGGSAMLAGLMAAGYHFERYPDGPNVATNASATSSGPSSGGGGAPGSSGRPGGGGVGGGGSGGGFGGGRPGRGFGGGGPGGDGGSQGRRDLVNLVRKLDLLTGDIKISLTPEQSDALRQALAGVEDAKTLSNEDAQAKYDELAKLLTSEQMETQKLVELPRLPRDSRLGSPTGPSPDVPPDVNPFGQTEVQDTLKALRLKLGGEPGGTTTDTGEAGDPGDKSSADSGDEAAPTDKSGDETAETNDASSDSGDKGATDVASEEADAAEKSPE